MSKCENGTRHSDGRPCPNRARWFCGIAGAVDAKKICPVHLSPYLEGLCTDRGDEVVLHVVRLP